MTFFELKCSHNLGLWSNINHNLWLKEFKQVYKWFYGIKSYYFDCSILRTGHHNVLPILQSMFLLHTDASQVDRPAWMKVVQDPLKFEPKAPDFLMSHFSHTVKSQTGYYLIIKRSTGLTSTMSASDRLYVPVKGLIVIRTSDIPMHCETRSNGSISWERT